mmetsp:Transcript_23870/g.63154  ORF Transcript_23870/g.63154 Transcript_23870/m.63154 type:complete len:98 (+) Transcript_23870:88-381(+)
MWLGALQEASRAKFEDFYEDVEGDEKSGRFKWCKDRASGEDLMVRRIEKRHMSQKMCRRVARELRCLRMVDQKNIVTVVDVFSSADFVTIVMANHAD